MPSSLQVDALRQMAFLEKRIITKNDEPRYISGNGESHSEDEDQNNFLQAWNNLQLPLEKIVSRKMYNFWTMMRMQSFNTYNKSLWRPMQLRKNAAADTYQLDQHFQVQLESKVPNEVANTEQRKQFDQNFQVQLKPTFKNEVVDESADDLKPLVEQVLEQQDNFLKLQLVEDTVNLLTDILTKLPIHQYLLALDIIDNILDKYAKKE